MLYFSQGSNILPSRITAAPGDARFFRQAPGAMQHSKLMFKLVFAVVLAMLLSGGRYALATQEDAPELYRPFHRTPDIPSLDRAPAPATKPDASAPRVPNAAGPIAPAGAQPVGALSGRIVFTSGGHGWNWTGSSWALERPLLLSMNEDTGNVDQMTMFVFYCFNAGATVVPMRPVGYQTNEVVLDNVSSASDLERELDGQQFERLLRRGGRAAVSLCDDLGHGNGDGDLHPNIPVAGLYPVYTWVLTSSNRTNQLYRINHTGGQSLVRVPHHMVGNGWVYLGTYYFNAGSHPATGSVIISNLGEGASGGSVVIADAIRFGNGMGDVNLGGGVSTYPREDECSRFWVQRALGQGQDPNIAAFGNVGAPIRMGVEMNREAAGNMYKRVYVGFHSNAGGGRGVTGLYNNTSLFPGTATPNQFRLAQLLGSEVNTDMVGIGSPPLEVAWYNRGSSITFARTDYAFGEINNTTIQDEFDATIVEVAFHDDASDSLLLRDSKARNWIARAVYHGVVRYMNQFDALPLSFLPEPPFNVKAVATSDAIKVSWWPPMPQANSGAPTNYVVYRSSDGYGFGNPVSTGSAGITSLTLTGLDADTDYYFRVAAVNAGGESFPSETVGCRRSSHPLSTRILFVNGFTRFDRTLNLRQSLAARQYKPPGHDGNSGTVDRVMPARVNSFDYVVQHGKAISAASSMGFDSCQLQSVTNGTVNLSDYGIVVWESGNQSTADRTFNTVAQAKITAFLAGGGDLFVSGAEIAWDLDRASGPTTADRNFIHNQLHASLLSNANDDSGVYTFTPVAGSIFAGNPTGTFDDGSRGIYWVGYPDALTPMGTAAAALSYPGFSGGSAGVRYDGLAGGGKVIYFGFPFETITSPSVREAYMADILKDFSRPVRFEQMTLLADHSPRLVLSGEPGLTYAIQRSTDFANWVTLTNLLDADGLVEFVDAPASGTQRFYRTLRQ